MTNVRKLAELIYDTGDADRILATLEALAGAGVLDCLKPDAEEGRR